jgi:hypothetical protein
METSQLVPNRLYAFREKRVAGEAMLKVRVLEVVGRKGRVKVRFEDGPHPGLDEYVHSRQLVVPWGERTSLLRDEERLERLKQLEREGVDPAVATAVEVILEATGERTVELMGWGIEASPEAVERVMARAGIVGTATQLHPLAFVDRLGRAHIPTAGAEVLARAFAAAEPGSVTMHLEAVEREMHAKGYEPGDRFWHDYLREQRPGFALARSWSGFDRELENCNERSDGSANSCFGPLPSSSAPARSRARGG